MPGLTTHKSEGAKLFVKLDSNFVEIPGISGYTESGGEAPTRDIIAFSGAAKRTGEARVPDVECAGVFAPAHWVWKQLQDDLEANTTREFQIELESDTVLGSNAKNKAAITASTGAVTISAGGSISNFLGTQFAPGMAITIGGEDYFIASIDPTTGAATVNPKPGADVAEAAFTVKIPAVRRGPFSAGIRAVGNASLESEADLTTVLSLAPINRLPKWVAF